MATCLQLFSDTRYLVVACDTVSSIWLSIADSTRTVWQDASNTKHIHLRSFLTLFVRNLREESAHECLSLIQI